MSSIQETYEIGQIMKLIDLNENVTNFEIDFQVSSDNNAEFYMAIIDQATLDEGDLEYKNIKGAINGNIRNDKNEYHSYMMALKADNPCKISVKTNFQRLPDNIPQDIPTPDPPPTPSPPPVKKSSISWKYIIIGIVVVVGLFLLYYFYTHGDSNSNNNKYTSYKYNSKSFNPSLSPSVQVPGSSLTSNLNTGSYDIFEKLRNLPLK